MVTHHPTHFGRYEVRDVLGRGSMGVVYRAWDPILERDVAVKTLNLDDELTEEERTELLTRFELEAKTAGALHHPGIVVIHDFGLEDEQPYLAMEVLTGRDLRQIVAEDGPLAPEEAIPIFVQIAAAIDYAHARGVIHRDLKPANLFVTTDGIVKITDFGIARVRTGRITQAGVSLGSPLYMSPEQVLGVEIDYRSDLFSFGSTTYEALTGIPAFTGENIGTISYRVVHGQPEPPSRLSPAIPASWDAIIARALSKDPDSRWPDAMTFVSALEEAHLSTRPRGPAKGAETRPVSPANAETDLLVDPAAVEAAGRPASLIFRKAVFREVPRRPLLGPILLILGLVLASVAGVGMLRQERRLLPGATATAADSAALASAVPILGEATVGEVGVAADGATRPLADATEAILAIHGESRLRAARIRVLSHQRVIWQEEIRRESEFADDPEDSDSHLFGGITAIPPGDATIIVELYNFETARTVIGSIKGRLPAGETRILELTIGPRDFDLNLKWR